MIQRILVCGDRNWEDYHTIHSALGEFSPESVVLHGGCRGADRIGGAVAKSYGMKVIVFMAEWGKYKNAAGPIRNTRMLNEGKPDVVLAFHGDIKRSKGTKNMIAQACERGIDVILYE